MLHGIIGNKLIAPWGNGEFGYRINSTVGNTPVFTAASLADGDFTWLKPDGVTTFTGKAPAAANFNQVGLYRVTCTNWALVTGLSCFADKIVSLRFDPQMAALATLSTSNCGSLTAIDVSPLTALNSFSFSSTPFTSLDLSNNDTISIITALDASLTSLDLTDREDLTSFALRVSDLSSLVLDGCVALATASLEEATVTTLDFSDCVAMTSLTIAGCQNLSNLVVENSVILWSISVADSSLAMATLPDSEVLAVVHLTGNQFTNASCKAVLLHLVDTTLATEGELSLQGNPGTLDTNDSEVNDGITYMVDTLLWTIVVNEGSF